MNNHFINITEKFKNQKIAIIGEAFLDAYLQGYTERICREAPVPIVDIQKKHFVPGGAANTAVNIAKLLAHAYFLSVVGDDTDGKILIKRLEQLGVDMRNVIVDKNRKTMAKKRIIADGQILLRFDDGTTENIANTIEQTFIDRLIAVWSEVDGVIISDYGYGIITDNVIEAIKELQQNMPRILVVDSKYLDKFINIKATMVKPNYKEVVALLGLTKTLRGEARIKQISQYKYDLIEKTNASLIAVTLDSEGSLIIDKNGGMYRTYTDKVENPKVAGAGDTYVAVFTLGLISSSESKTAAEIAANATKIIINKEGTAFCTAAELHALLTTNNKFITDRKLLNELVNLYKNQGKKIVFTNGCFDILHSGHVNYLNQAKAFGDILILGINTDESIKRIKGSDRPINTLNDRMQVLSALSSITYLVPMPEDTASELIKVIKPAIYVKGGDYTLETLPESKIVLQYGGKVEFIALTKGKSTTGIIKRIKQEEHAGKYVST